MEYECEPDMSLEDAAKLAKFEMSCEKAWLNVAEYDQEAYDEMMNDDLQGKW